MTGAAERMRILVTGAAGQLGQAMVARLRPLHAVTAWTRAEIDLANHGAVRDAIAALRPQAILNCASYNNVDKAEDEQVAALDINAMAVGTLARAAVDAKALLVHYSTDFVFSGTATTPYTELDEPEPRSVYAQSKLIGEWLAADVPDHYVLRVESLFGGAHRRSSIDRIASAIRSGEPAQVFADRVVSPSFVQDVIEASLFVLHSRPEPGVYHCVNSGYATWLDVGREIAGQLGASAASLKAVSVHDVKLRAARPQFAALNNGKLARAGHTMPAWQDAIRRYLQTL
ncbi:MAG TPA: NAD(P)-dependent oxidoreductase [Vicinamibacterales bacterium]|nr:NAD(P)-dependent oxidoreductase [Vicinamibacterales bacterium]